MSDPKKMYYVTADVTKAVGYQTFKVEAASKEEAILKVSAGGGDFFTAEIEIQGFGIFEVTGEYVIEDEKQNTLRRR